MYYMMTSSAATFQLYLSFRSDAGFPDEEKREKKKLGAFSAGTDEFPEREGEQKKEHELVGSARWASSRSVPQLSTRLWGALSEI